MGFVPFTYWGYGCNDLLPTGSLVFYYNANNDISFDKAFTGSSVNNTNRGIINLANQGTQLGIVYGTGSFNETYYGIDTLGGGIDNNIPLTLYDSAQQGTILLKGYIAPLLNAQDKYLLRNPSNSNEGIRAFGTVNVTTKGQFTFSRGVVDANGLPTASMYTTEGYGTIALTKEVGQNYGVLSTATNNFATKFSGSAAINEFYYIFERLGYFQAAAYWNRKLSDTELISASRAFNCNGLPQGFNATSASAISSPVKWNGGGSGTTAYYLKPNETTLTRRIINPGEEFYDCVCNTGSRLDVGGSGVSTVRYQVPCQVSASTTYPTVEYLLLGGGGGGGFGFVNNGGGGGAGGGGYLSGSLTLATGSSYSIVVGAGGSGATTSSLATNGGDTTAFSLTAFGGGRGGSASGSLRDGSIGGCGGGSANTSSYLAPGTQGGSGSASGVTPPLVAGAGGGVANSGNPVQFKQSGNGGDGKAWLELTPTYRGAGGGGGGAKEGTIENSVNRGTPGLGGTGFGGWANGTTGNGTANMGDGGGGGYSNYAVNQRGGNGGSGLVAIRYNGNPQFSAGTIQQYLGMTYHYFTSSFTLNT